MFGQSRYAEINAMFNTAIEARRPLIVVHRGTGQGSVVENTARAVEAAFAQGADMVEFDLIESTDGEFFLFHDGYEPAAFGIPARSIMTLTAQEIRALRYEWYCHDTNPIRVEELATVLDAYRGKPGRLFNVDRSWWYWEDLLPRLDRFDMVGQLVLKSPAEDEWLDQLRRHPVKYPFIPMIRSADDLDRIIGDPDINLVGAEIIAADPGHEFVSAEFIERMRGRGVAAFLNAIVLPDGVPLFGGYDDEVSLFTDPDLGWGRLMELGADLIQTDWPDLLAQYRSSLTHAG